MDYLKDLFDGYYLKREYNRDMEKVKTLSGWCWAHGKTLHLLANSGCMNFCPARHFHDTLVAHEEAIKRQDNAFAFEGLCRSFFAKEENRDCVLSRLNFIRPEEVSRYEPYIDSVKLATRVSRAAPEILIAYTEGRFSGDLLSLLEPAHSLYPYVLENGDPPRLVKIADDR